MTYFISYILPFILVMVVIGLVKFTTTSEVYFNSKAVSKNDRRFITEFRVEKIESAYDADFLPIAKYLVVNYFFEKKNNKKFTYQYFYFYDTIGKFKVGDVLTLTDIHVLK